MSVRTSKVINPVLIFAMPVDNEVVIPGYNRGRLSLIDSIGELGRWVFSSSVPSKQDVKDWNIRGGVCPPTSAMPGERFWEFHTARLQRPGFTVDDGFLITFDGNTSYQTKDGATRSEIMLHPDLNSSTNLGSLGCIVSIGNQEYYDFCATVEKYLSHLVTIPLYVLYTY
jgi:hypothetical protein